MFSVPDIRVADSLIASELLTRTTLCWSPLIITDEKEEATVSFYTNDVKGRFTCILQGITNERVIHGKTSFIVKE